MMNGLRRWLLKRRADRMEWERRSSAELHHRFKYMEQHGICTGCYGRGAVDDPPWGIVRCDECGGTGKIP